MITIITCSPEKKKGYIVGGSGYQPGQWVFVSGYDSDAVMPKVYDMSIAPTSTGNAWHGRLFPITRFPIDDTEWQSMNEAGYTFTILDRVIGLTGGDVVIEDDKVYDLVGTGIWTAATVYVGCPLYINATGFVTPVAIAGQEPVATLEMIDDTAAIIQYRTLE